MLSRSHSEEKKLNGRMLQIIMQNNQFLGRQGLALREHDGGEQFYPIDEITNPWSTWYC